MIWLYFFHTTAAQLWKCVVFSLRIAIIIAKDLLYMFVLFLLTLFQDGLAEECKVDKIKREIFAK
mgnify:CR=1 FL=1